MEDYSRMIYIRYRTHYPVGSAMREVTTLDLEARLTPWLASIAELVPSLDLGQNYLLSAESGAGTLMLADTRMRDLLTIQPHRLGAYGLSNSQISKLADINELYGRYSLIGPITLDLPYRTRVVPK